MNMCRLLYRESSRCSINRIHVLRRLMQYQRGRGRRLRYLLDGAWLLIHVRGLRGRPVRRGRVEGRVGTGAGRPSADGLIA